MFSYQDSRQKIDFALNKINKTNKGYGDLKKLLLAAEKHNYLSSNLANIKANTKVGKKLLVSIVITFNSLQLVTTKTIKSRGWTDKMIAQHLQVDIWAKNPYYKSSGDMKLYCLSRIENLESCNPDIKSAIAVNLAKRQKLKVKKEQKLADAPLKWLAAIGDPDIAIALLTRLLNKAVKDIKDCVLRLQFYEIKDKILNKLLSYKTTTLIARKEYYDNRLLYCHWFNIKGYKLSFHSYQSLGYEGSFSLEQYNIKFGSKLDKNDQKLLFNLSG